MKKQNKDLLRHIVIFKFNDNASEADVKKLNDNFNALPDHISVIKDFEWGLNDSIYTPHPKHQEFVASLQPHLEKVFVVDYWAK